MSIHPPLSDARSPGSDRALLDRTAGALAEAFDLAGSAQGSWGNWPRLGELRAGQPAFVLRRTSEGLSLDTQRWDISGGAGCWPTTRILSVSLPWWRRLAERPAQRCLIPVTACTAPLPPKGGRDGRSAWFTIPDEPVFTIAGLWRDTGDGRCFAMLGCPAEAVFPILPVVIAASERATWLNADWDIAAPLMAPPAPDRIRIGLPEFSSPFYVGDAPGRPGDRPWAPVGQAASSAAGR